MSTKTEATVDDLYRVPENGKAELVNGELVLVAKTLVVWDVDVLREKLVRVYRASEPDAPTIYRAGEFAEAQPSMPGWSLAVNEILQNSDGRLTVITQETKSPSANGKYDSWRIN
jgi:hypothetical protein